MSKQIMKIIFSDSWGVPPLLPSSYWSKVSNAFPRQAQSAGGRSFLSCLETGKNSACAKQLPNGRPSATKARPPEEPDECQAENILWMPPEARQEELKNNQRPLAVHLSGGCP